MIVCVGRNKSPLFKLMKHMIVAFDAVCILFNFNINIQVEWK